MKNLKNIGFALVIALSFASCKQENKEVVTDETKETSATKTETLAENLETASFAIEGMTCEIGCAKLIEGKVAGKEGVSEIKVDFETKIATIKFDKTKQTLESLTEIIEKVGGGDLYKVIKTEKI